MKSIISLFLFTLLLGSNCLASSNHTIIDNFNFTRQDNCPDTVTNNQIETLSTDICAGDIVTFTGSEPTITPFQEFTYQWQSKIAAGDWQDISEATVIDYTSNQLTETTSFRRLVDVKACNNIHASNEITVTVQPAPNAPDFTVTDNCNGTSELTATTYDINGTLEWSTGESTESIVVNTAGNYWLQQTVDGCTSQPTTKTAVPKSTPTLAVSENDPLNCGEQGSLGFTFTNVPDGNYTINYDEGIFSNVTVSGGAATVSANAGTFSNLTITAAGCTSESGVSAALSDPNPPAAPTVSVQNNCGESVLTATNFTGDLSWSNGATTASITVTEAGDYTVTQTINGCTSDVATATAAPKPVPTISATGNDPTECGGLGSIDFTFTNVPDGNHTIAFDGGNFQDINVSGGSASVNAPADTYSNLKITEGGCTSTDNVSVTLSDPNPPAAPTITIENLCGESILTANSSEINPQYKWDTGETTKSITVIDNGNHTVTQTVNGCTSNAASASATPKTVPALTATKNNPANCGGLGTISFTFTNVPNGTYTIFYDSGNFSGVAVNNSKATVQAEAGTYNNLKINVNGCASAGGTNISLADPNPPSTPTVTVVNECEQSVLTASNYTGTLNWSTGGTGESITVTTAGTYSVTQTVNGCTSEAASATAAPKSRPTIAVSENDPANCNEQGSLDFTFTGVPDGNYTISYDGGSFTGVTVSGNTATVLAGAGTYQNLKITVNGCTSNGINATLSDPNPPSAPTVAIENQCGESVLTASNYSGTLHWSTGEATESIIVNEGGIYTVTQTVNGCTSSETNATASPKTIPTLTAQGVNPASCQESGSINFTFTGVPDGTYSIYYDGGNFNGVSVSGNKATVQADAGAYNNLVISVNGCVSADGKNVALSDPNPPSKPTISVANNCGESVLTASNYTGTIKWSTGETSKSITVSDAGIYSVTQTVNGCTSDAATATAAPKNAPVLSVAENDPENCGAPGSLNFSFTGVPNGTYTIAYDGGSFTGVSVSANQATVSAEAGAYNNLKITVNGCISANGINAALNDPNPPSAPTIAIENNCGETVLTATNYTGTLKWSTGETSKSIIVTDAGTYSVTQTVGGCTSNPSSATVSPKAIPAFTVEKIDPLVCQGLGTINFTFSGVPDGLYNIFYDAGSFPAVLVVNNKAIVTAKAGTYNNLIITVNGCTSADGVNIALSDPNPPATPVISVENNCGESVLTASNFTGSLLWSNGETGTSITVTDTRNYSVIQTLNGCTSNAATATAAPKPIPTISVSENDPESCLGLGSVDFTFTSVPNGNYTISYDGGSFTGVSISNNSATVAAGAGTYNNLKITVNGCTSANGVNAVLTDPVPPEAPEISVDNGCGESTLTATGFDSNATLNWSTGETGESIIVIQAGSYNVSQTVDGCTSENAVATASPKPVPALSVQENDPEVCQGEGSIDFTFTGVPNGNYTITYDSGSFTGVAVSNNTATVPAEAGTYNNLTITVDGCSSADGINASLTDPNAPAAPVITVENNCGESVLTASGYDENATLEWSNGKTDESIIVIAQRVYSLTQTLNGCTSDAAVAVAAPKPIPAAPDFSVTDNCDGTSTLMATTFEENATLEWSTGATAVVILVDTSGNYSLKQTVDGCESEPTTKAVAPKSQPTVAVAENDPAICGEQGSIEFTFTDVPNGNYTILYDGGSFTNVSVQDNSATVITDTGTYENLTIEVNGCISDEGVNATLSDPNAPAAPIVTVENNCGESVLTASGYDPDAVLKWNTGAGDNEITVIEAGTYRVTQTLNGCISDAGMAVAAPKAVPETPDFTVTDNCDGTSTLTAVSFDENAVLEWSTSVTGETTEVSEAGNYGLIQIIDGCESAAVIKEANPKTAPAIVVASENNPLNCQQQGSLELNFTGVPNGTYTLMYDGGSFENVSVLNNTAKIPAFAGSYNNLTITVNGCTSAIGTNAILRDPNAPETPVISVENFCGQSILTATNYDENATLTWNTGETGPVITVTDARIYKVTQKLNGCISDATAEATPFMEPEKPLVNVADSCGGSVITINNPGDDAWFIWQNEIIKDSTKNNGFIITEPGIYTLHQRSASCISDSVMITVNPLQIPEAPISMGDKQICKTDPIQPLTAEASLADTNSVLVWYDQESGGNEVFVPILDEVGTVTYYAEAQNPVSGCASASRTPVTLSIADGFASLNLDTEIIGKPNRNVAVLIFPEDSMTYQWYLNDNMIASANEQYYYISEQERVSENLFSVEVETVDGCKAIFDFQYPGNLNSGEIDAIEQSFNFGEKKSINIYPNPADQNLSISVDSELLKNEHELNAKIFSDNGACVEIISLTKSTETVNTGQLKPGYYTVVIFNKKQPVDSKKLIISH